MGCHFGVVHVVDGQWPVDDALPGEDHHQPELQHLRIGRGLPELPEDSGRGMDVLDQGLSQLDVDQMHKLEDPVQAVFEQGGVHPLHQDLEIDVEQFLEGVAVMPDQFFVLDDGLSLCELFIHLFPYLHLFPQLLLFLQPLHLQGPLLGVLHFIFLFLCLEGLLLIQFLLQLFLLVVVGFLVLFQVPRVHVGGVDDLDDVCGQSLFVLFLFDELGDAIDDLSLDADHGYVLLHEHFLKEFSTGFVFDELESEVVELLGEVEVPESAVAFDEAFQQALFEFGVNLPVIVEVHQLGLGVHFL